MARQGGTSSPLPAIPQDLIEALDRNPVLGNWSQHWRTTSSSETTIIDDIRQTHRARLDRLPSVVPQTPFDVSYQPESPLQPPSSSATSEHRSSNPQLTHAGSLSAFDQLGGVRPRQDFATERADGIGLAVSTASPANQSRASIARTNYSVSSPGSANQWLLDAQRAHLHASGRRSSQQHTQNQYDSPFLNSESPDTDQFYDASEEVPRQPVHPSAANVQNRRSSPPSSPSMNWSRRASEQFVLDLERAARAEQLLAAQLDGSPEIVHESPLVPPSATTAPSVMSTPKPDSRLRESGSSMAPASWYHRDESPTSRQAHSSAPPTTQEFGEEQAALTAMQALTLGKPTFSATDTARATVESGAANFTVAIVGPKGVGKSSIVRRGLKKPIVEPTALLRDAYGNEVTSSMSQFTIGGQLRTIEVLEIDAALLSFDATGVVWPEGVPNCEAAMLCYDSTDPKALHALSKLLQAFWIRGSEIPLIVLACKAHTDPSLNATDLNRAAAVVNVYGAGIVALDGGERDPKRKTKESFNWLIRQIMANRGEDRRPSLAFSTCSNEERRQSSAESTAMSRSDTVSSTKSTSSRGLLSLSVVNENPVGTKASQQQKTPVIEAEPPSMSLPPTESLQKTPGSLDMFFSKDQLVDKFLFATVTGTDEQYIIIFLTVYRKFATPREVLTKLVARFDFVGARSKTDPLLSRYAQMKLCGVLSTWLQIYPGDFVGSSTRQLLQEFVRDKLGQGAQWVSHYVAEIVPLVDKLAAETDPDFTWALPDGEVDDKDSLTSDTKQGASRDANLSMLGTTTSDPTLSDMSTQDSLSLLDHPDSLRRTPSRSECDSATVSTHNSLGRGKSISSPSLNEKSRQPLLADLSTALMEIPEDVVATQITRLTWKAFSVMTRLQPRDLLRHVLAPRDPRNPSVALRNTNSAVSRSIQFVNYLADWVATMILVQSKLKHRARMLEKFISIASRLREQENFDALLGVLAGLNSQPVYRLTETMQLVNQKLEGDKHVTSKKLRSLNKLMANSKSFAAYRMALANSGASMIPYLGVHLQDITAVHEVKRDMRDGKVNWTKFQQIGRSAAVVLDCSKVAPTLVVDKSVERIISGVPVLDKERQYTLSEQHQPRTTPSTKMSTRQRFQSFLT
ncbi:hypothetical protein OIV83_000790 [Microbotryomycetes sp. JL201]|nr:hypothetical protein OIV83_000790 [Microbotryomycetes sp. JL201]